MSITYLMNINGIRRSVWIAVCLAVLCVAAPAVSLEEFKSDYACRAVVVDPASAANLQRPHALRYRAAPLRVCVPDDADNTAFVVSA